ncbi:MAG: protein translocase subunit SecF [Treponema sp.]|nr:protein translocase subunit SecF [Treponema sp.]
MKKIINFSKFFKPAAVISIILVVFSISGYIINKGFTLGVDFQAGHVMEVKVAPPAFSLYWNGSSRASFEHDSRGLRIIVPGVGEDSGEHDFPFNDYNTIGSLVFAMREKLRYLNVSLHADENITSERLVFSIMGNSPVLSPDIPYVIRYLPENSPIDISDVRAAMADFSHGGVSIQSLGAPDDRYFMIRVESREDAAESAVSANESSDAAEGTDIVSLEEVIETAEDTEFAEAADEQFEVAEASDDEMEPVNAEETQVSDSIVRIQIVQTLEKTFGDGNIAVIHSNFVGSRFSKNLTDQAGMLISLTLLLILIYSAIRFKLQYAVGAVVAIIYDGLVMVAFMVWTQMEFTTLSIAAILTILGYSTNNTIIFFDRVRENLRINPDHSFKDILNMSLTGILGRTIITTASTMLAVLALFIFTTGAMKDFALALIVGMISGVFTTLFIVSGFVNFWQNLKLKRQKKKAAAA